MKSTLLEDGDKALTAVKQVALTRQFDIKQATEVVNTIGELSPFEKVEAAVIMYNCLINKDSYNLILDCFPVAADRDNICHRLKVEVTPSGEVVRRKP